MAEKDSAQTNKQTDRQTDKPTDTTKIMALGREPITGIRQLAKRESGSGYRKDEARPQLSVLCSVQCFGAHG